ncbi:MAG: vitamin B12-dependent ribonucleotide reductase, partial [Planctomycetota bacterium]
CLDMDHPDIGDFVDWKVREELKVQAMVEGARMLKEKSKDFAGSSDELGLTLDYDFNGEAYATVAGQNSNNSVRIPDAFFEAVDGGGAWQTYRRTDKAEAKTFDARELWDKIGYAAWRCADPGVQYDSTINAWHTCPSAGRINASNPCSEYMFLDNTACNLASLNVIKFYDREGRTFDIERYEHAIDLWTIVLEISVLMAAFPSQAIAELSWKYRTLGLGYANLGAMLMQAGIPYDSDEGRSVCACLSAILTGRSYRTSAMLAGEHGAFAGYEDDKDNMLRVMRNHKRAAHGIGRKDPQWEGLKIRPVPIDHGIVRDGRINLANAESLLDHAVKAWDDAVAHGEEHGYRNAQTTVIAPTGTIGLLMDCDTTGVEPDFALVKFKKLAGGGYFKIVNASVDPALESLGYHAEQRKDVIDFIVGTLSLDTPMPKGAKGAQKHETLQQWLKRRGLTNEDLQKITDGLPGVFELGFAFSAWGLGDDALKRLGLDVEKAKADPSFNALKALGLKAKHIDELNAVICGSQTIEGAPHMKDEHLPVFDCANKCGPTGQRFIHANGHIRMMAAAQPFISGAISKTINLPNDASVEDIQAAYRLSWELGLKANALYRDGCKLSQPLSTKSSDGEMTLDEADAEVDEVGEAEALEEVATVVVEAAQQPEPARMVEAKKDVERRPMRRRLPDTRGSITHKFNIAGHEGYLTVGLYEDGMPGELFITMAKEGSTIGGLMDSLGTATSVALQYGVPVKSLVNKFTHQRFEPAGMTGNPEIPIAKSLVDYIFRWLGIQFIEGYREANTPNR